MGNYLKNTIVNYSRKTLDNYSVQDYTAKSMIDIRSYINELSSDYFSYYEIKENDTLERISYELYGTPDYWDIILLINDQSPLKDTPYSYDAISLIAEQDVQDFESEIYKNTIPINERELIIADYIKTRQADSESKRIIRVMKQSKISIFLQELFELNL